MSQFRIKGIDYIDERPDDYLMHTGPGKPGRSVGSKNGQIDPRAVSMKYYDVVGKKAQGEAARPGSIKTNPYKSTTLKTYGSGTSGNRSAARQPAAAPRTRTTTPSTSVVSINRGTVSGPRSTVIARGTTGASTAAGKVEKGKSMLNSMSGNNTASTQTTNTATTQTTTPPKRSRDMSMAELRALDPVGDWPWSNRRVRAAGGLEAREGRQIIYDNPTLNEDYKKQVAKKYGDSDGRSYPKYLEETPANNQPAQTPEVNANAGNQQANADNRDLTDVKNVLQKDARTQQAPAQNQNQTQTQQPTAQVQAQPFDAGRGDNGGIQPDRPVSDAGRGDTDSDRGSEETPEQKSFWDRLGGWFNQAGKDIGNTVSGAWNTATGAINDAAVWVGDRLKDGGEWALTSMGDVGKWIGDRAKDLDHWWNGEDIEVNDNGHWRQGHRDGVREQIGNAANAAGQWIGNAAGDVGRTVGNAANAAGQWIGNAAGDVGKAVNDAARGLDYWWNGTPYNELDPSTVGFVPGDPNSNPRVGGAWRDITSAIGSAGSTIGDAANAVGQWVGNAANDVGTAVDEAWNGKQRTIRKPGPNGNTIIENVREGGIRPGIENAVNAAGKWIGDQANAVGQGVSNFVNGVRPGEAQPYYDVQSGKWVDPTMPSLGERIQGGVDTVRQGLSNFGQAAADTATNAWNGATEAARNFGQGVANTASNLWNGASSALGNAGQAVSNGFTDAYNRVTGNTQEAADAATVRALDAGVPADYVDYWRGMLSSGAISPAQYSQQMNDYISNPNMTVNNPNFGNAQQPQQGNWFNDSIVTPVANGWNGMTNFVRDTANNAVQGANNLWNGTDQSFLGIPTGHTPGLRENIGNAISNFGQGASDLAGNVGQTVANGAQNLWNGATSALGNAGQAVSNGVTNAYNQVTGNTMENADNATARALNAGIPADYVGQLRDQLTAGQINPAQYVQQIDNLLGNPNMTDPNRR